MNNFDPRNARQLTPKEVENLENQENQENEAGVQRRYDRSTAREYVTPNKGATGFIKDLGLSAGQGLAKVPGSLLAIADAPTTGGKAGKWFEDNGYNFGDQIAQELDKHRTERSKQQRFEYQQAGEQADTNTGRVLNKLGYALSNPSMIADTVAQSIPDMVVGGKIGGKLSNKGKRFSAEAGAAVGEGAMMAGHAFENIRQDTDERLLSGEQVGYGVATGAAGALFSWGGNRLAKKLGLADVDTLIAKGLSPQEIAQNIASMPAKSVPKAIIQGAVSEGFLEELPQEVTETILGNLATGKEWSEGIDDAIVMGTLAGMAMGGTVGGVGAFSSNRNRIRAQNAQQPEEPAQELEGFEPQPNTPPQFDGGMAPQQIQDQYRTETLGRGFKPSEQLGLNPNNGSLSAAAALSVDSGASPIGLNSIPHEGEYLGPANEVVPSARGFNQNRNSTYGLDPYGNITDVDGRSVPVEPSSAPRLPFNERQEGRAPVYEVDPQGNATPTSGEAAESRKMRINTSGLKGRHKENQAEQIRPEPTAPADTAKNVWGSLNTYQRAKALKDALGLEGNELNQVAVSNWESLSDEHKAKLTEAMGNEQSSTWTDPNARNQDDSAPVLQNRDRSNAKSLEQMRDIATRPDYFRLGVSRDFGNGSPVIEEMNTLQPQYLGKADFAATAEGRRIPVQYAVVEAEQLLSSNDINGNSIPEYANGVEGMGRAIAGNGRITGLKQAWKNGTTTNYLNEMLDDNSHGINPEVIAGMKNPVLVRMMPKSEITQNIGDESNTGAQLGLTSLERAKTDARRVNWDDVRFNEAGTIDVATIAKFVQSMPSSENLVINGEFSQEAYDRLEAAMMDKAFGNDELTQMQAERDGESKSIIGALVQSAPTLIKLEGAGIYDIRPLIAEAASVAISARRRGVRLSEQVKQLDMGVSPEVYPILEMMLNEKGAIRSKEYIATQFKNIAELALKEAQTSGEDMFGEVPKRTQEETIKDAMTEVEGDGQLNTSSTEDMGQQGGAESNAEMDEQTGSEQLRPQDGVRTTTEGSRPRTEEKTEGVSTENWRTNYLKAAKKARELGIDPRQHKKLADLVKAIDEHTGNTQSEQADEAIQPTKATTKKPTKVKPTHFEEDLSADNDFDLTTQTEAELAELEEQRKQKEREEARIKAAEEAELKKTRDAESDRQQAEATVDDFELGQTADEQLTGPGLFSETNTDTPPTRTESYGSKNKLVSTERAEELRKRLKSKLNGRLNSGFDPEILAIGTELAAYHIEAGARKFIDFARAIAKDLDMNPQELRQYLRSWYNGARDMMEDSNVSISGMDSPSVVSQELSNLMSEEPADTSKPEPKEAQKNESKEDLEAIKDYVLNNIAKHEWRDSILAKREVIAALNEQGYPLEEVASALDIPLAELGSKKNIDQTIEHIFDNQQVNSTKGEENVSSAANDMEQGSDNAGSEETTDGLANDNESEGRRTTRANEQDSLLDTGESGLPEFSESLFDSSTTIDSERGDNAASDEGRPTTATPGTTRSDDNQRGGNAGNTGIPVDTTATEAVVKSVRTDVSSKLEQQKKAEGTATKRGDIDNIRQALPYLLEAQQDDVLKIEQRFMKPDGYGMLITNGTGTGKTFSGLGVVKRFVNEGKSNILIVTPDEKVASDWVQSGIPLNLEISQLQNTQDAGQGIVVTTYANLGANSSLSKRKFDLVVADEAHKLMQGADAKVTKALAAVRALTMHPEGATRMRDMRYPEQVNELGDLKNQINKLKGEIAEANENKAVAPRIAALEKKLEAVEDNYYEVSKYLRERLKEVKLEFEASQGAKRPRLLALTATPFSYVSSIDWANGYLFDYNEGRKDDGSGAYNEGDNRSKFFIENFGYRMRYNRLTQPDANVDVSLMERQFNERLRKSGALSGRTIDVPFDYDRRFILTESKIGQRIDEALQYIQDGGKNNPELKEGYAEIRNALKEHFSHLERRYLLEAIKAKAAIPIIKEHLKLGRKVVVFHDYKKGGSNNPFAAIGNLLSPKGKEAYMDFAGNFSDLTSGTALQGLESPITVFRNELPETLIVNGDENKRDILERYKKFQSDDSGPQVILVQSAKNAGWSGHDTTGKHQRVLINLGLPTTPSTSIQQEGRIYRVGQASNAIQRYMNTGTNWERAAFAQTIAQRSGTVENLSMGVQARALKQSFIDAFEDTGSYQPGHEGEGTGGKELDQSLQSIITPYDEAKSYYYGQRKRTSGNKSKEGKDYFATPEPVGFKMVEWLALNIGDSALEPSAGHGAIGRWLPEHSRRTFIEPSNELRSRLSLLVGGQTDRILDGDFESFNIINKFDGIAMNPPFGVGGKLAAEHVGKAMKHLRDGGRIAALIPEGPAANKQFEKLLNSEEAKELGIFEIAEFSLPDVTFERAGTKVKTRIIVLEKQLSDEGKQALPQHRRIDFSNAPTIDELFDRLEEISLPQRTVVPEGGKKNKGAKAKTETTKASGESVDDSGDKLTSWDGKHTKTGETLYMVKPNEKLEREQYNEVKSLASKHDGFWDRYTKGFRFNSSEERQAFLDDFNEAPLFSRNTNRSGGMTKAHVQNIANNLLGGNARQQNVHVVQNYAELPAEVKRAIGMDGTGEGDFNALHYKGKSYIVADAMGSQAEVEAAIFHEHFTHGGLRALYGKDLANKLDDMLFKSGGIVGVRMQAKKQGIDLSAYESALANNPNISEENKKRILMEELLAHMAHTTGTLRRRLEEVLGAIRQWLRDNGFAELANLKASDIAFTLRQAREAATPQQTSPQPVPSYARSENTRKGYGNRNELKYLRAFHGSPHLFNEFELERIGEGAGLQAYGHGLYFAGREDVARYYKEMAEHGEGNLYQVDIPEIDSLLNYNLPLDKQPKHVQASIKALMSKPEAILFAETEQAVKNNATGQELYNALSYDMGSQQVASEVLNDAGVPGLTYQGIENRATGGKDSTNYVIWDDNLVTIEAINGQQAQAQVMFSVQARRGRYNKNQLDLFEELNDLEGVDSYESTTQRKNTTEKQRQLGRSAITDLFRWLKNSSRTRSGNANSTENGVSLIGASIYKNFKAGKPYQLLGKTVNSTADLAALAQVYRDPRFETFRAFYLDKNNKVILEEAASTRMPASVAFAPGTIEGIKEKQEKVGASKVYILHNHPSGNPEPSGADVALTNGLNDILGSAFAGHVVIDHNKYAFINKQGDYTIHDAEELAGIDFSSNPEVPHELLENEIHGPSDIAVIGKKIAHSNHPVIVVTKGGLRSKVGLIASIPMELLERFISRSVIEQTQAKAVLRRMIRAGGVGGKLFVVLPKNADLSRYYQWMHDFAQDVVDSNGNSVIHAGNNVSIDDYSAKSISIRNKRITRKETTLREGTQNYNEEPQTETEAFKKWFGDSKVVDAQGKPLVVYHGSPDVRGIIDGGFKPSSLRGEVFFFSDSQKVANTYADDSRAFDYQNAEPHVLPVYLSLQNPYEVDAKGKKWRDTERHVQEALDGGYDGIIIKNSRDEYNNLGDGGELSTVYAAFMPSQIKSAATGNLLSRIDRLDLGDISNNGNFDPANPDIRFSRTSQAREALFNKAEDFAQKADSWAGRSEEIPSNWTDAQKAAADKFNTFKPKQPFSEKLDAIRNITKDKLAQKIFDQFRPLKALSEKAFKQAHLSRATDGALEAVATRGVPYLKDGAIAVRTDNSGFIGAMTKLGDMEEVRKFLMWVTANRADQLMAEGRENLFTPEDIAAMKAFSGGRLKDGRSRTVAYAEAQRQLREYNKAVLDIAEEAGLVNSESRPTWESEFYIPFYRVLENEDGTASGKYSHSDAKLVRQQVIRQLKGGKEKLGDPLENIMANWSSMLAASMRNMAANEALTQGQALGISGQVDEQSFAQGERGDTWTLQNGKRVHWHVADPMVMEALESINFNGYNNPLMRAAGKFKRALTVGVTISPTFRVRNLIRDTLHAMAVADVSFNPIANAVNGFKMSGRQTDTMAQLMAGGGAVRFGSFNDGQAGDYVKRMVNLGIKESDILSTPGKLTSALKRFYTEYQEFGDKAETINRAVVYDRIMRETGNHLEASFAARDVMNFSSMGSAAIIRAMAQTLPFFNARLQGMDKLVRGAAADPRRFWSVVGTIGMASSLLYLMNSDDDEYKAMPDFIRDTYWPIKLGGHWYYVPKPFEVGSMGTVIERFTELMFSDGDYKSNDLKNSLMSVLINQLELNPMPQILRPVIEAQFNYDTFRQRPIDSMAMERLLPEERYNANTSSAAIATGKVLGVSPQKVEHVIRGYFGWLGTQALNVSDLLGRSLVDRPSSTKWDLSQTNNMFFIGDFVKESGSIPSKYSTRFYDLQRELNQIYASANAARKAGDMERYRELMETPEMKAHPMFKAATSRITKVNQQIKRVTSDGNLSSKEKADKLRALYKRREAIAESIDKQARARGTI